MISAAALFCPDRNTRLFVKCTIVSIIDKLWRRFIIKNEVDVYMTGRLFCCRGRNLLLWARKTRTEWFRGQKDYVPYIV